MKCPMFGVEVIGVIHVDSSLRQVMILEMSREPCIEGNDGVVSFSCGQNIKHTAGIVWTL